MPQTEAITIIGFGVAFIIILVLVCNGVNSFNKFNKRSSYPWIRIGEKYKWVIRSDNPFESETISTCTVTEIKEDDNGDAWVKYKTGICTFSEPIGDFASKYREENI